MLRVSRNFRGSIYLALQSDTISGAGKGGFTLAGPDVQRAPTFAETHNTQLNQSGGSPYARGLHILPCFLVPQKERRRVILPGRPRGNLHRIPTFPH